MERMWPMYGTIRTLHNRSIYGYGMGYLDLPLKT